MKNAMANCILPQELMLCILSWVLVKSLMRFKSLCKPWLYLFSKSKFIEIHHQQFSRGPKICSLKFHSLSKLIMELPSKTIHGDLGNIFIESCRGLVCVGRPLFSRDIMLWNPATNLWKTLPHSNWKFKNLSKVSMGFGCNVDDAVGYDYKVVRLLRMEKKQQLRTGVEVYSSKIDSWKRIQVEFKFFVLPFANHVIVNGTPYWVAWIDVEGEDQIVLLGFGCTNMEFKIVPMPNLEMLKVTFVDWKESLGGVVCMKNDENWLESIDVWVYDDGESVWTRKESYGGLKLQVGRCMNVSRNGKIFGSCMDDTFFLYNTEINHITIIDLKIHGMYPCKTFPYEECLTFVQGMMSMVACQEDSIEENINTIERFFLSNVKFWCRPDIECLYALGC